MLDALKKAVGMQPKEDMEQIAPVDEAKQMNVETSLAEQLQVSLDEIVAKDNMLSEFTTKIDTLAKEIEGYKEQLANLQSYADEAQAKALAAAEELKAKELSDKREQLADVIGKDNPGFDVTFAALQSLNAEAFGVVLNGFKASFEAEAKSPMFTEVGVSGEAEVKPEEKGLNVKKYVTKKTK